MNFFRKFRFFRCIVIVSSKEGSLRTLHLFHTTKAPRATRGAFCVQGGVLMAGGIFLEIDASDTLNELKRLEYNLTPRQINLAMYRVMKRVPGNVRSTLGKEVPKDYEIKSGEVRAAVKGARVGYSGGGVGCTIPVVGPRRTIGNGFKASGGAKGWESLRKKYRVRARIVKGQISVLPQNMASYGGNPPFRNLSASRLRGIAFTRKGKDRFPIQKVEGIAIPQMPMNRSEGKVQKGIQELMDKRVAHEIERLIGR